MPEDIIFNPYDTGSQSMSGGLSDDGTGIKTPQADADEEKVSGEEKGIDLVTGLIIALCTAGGVVVGAAVVIGALVLIKKKTGHIL